MELNDLKDPRDTKTMKVVYSVTERAGRSYWTRVGVGYENRDGSLNLKLDAIPVNGTLQVREWEAAERRGPGQAGQAGQTGQAGQSGSTPFDDGPFGASTSPRGEDARPGVMRRREPEALA